MTSLRYSLIADGSSDRCLIPIIDWLLDELLSGAGISVSGQVADLRGRRMPPSDLDERIEQAVALYPCDVLFVHRDAERAPREARVAEIREGVESAGIDLHVPVVPVRMTEAWLLIDERAVRQAAANPNGTVPLDMPVLSRLESLSDPKAKVQELLVAASQKTGRRLKQFRRDLNGRIQGVAGSIHDYSPLRQLTAFQAFEDDTRAALQTMALRAKERRRPEGSTDD